MRRQLLSPETVIDCFFVVGARWGLKRWNHVVKAQDAREIQVPLPHGKIAGSYRNFMNIRLVNELTFSFIL
jgi:hypothetical protein